MEDVLTHLGIDVWLEDRNGSHLPLGLAVVDVNLNKISTVIKIEHPQGYCVRWRKNEAASPMNAWCEIFRPAGKSGHIKTVRIASHVMVADDAQTQTRSSKGRLEHPLPKDAWLWPPRSGTGFVFLKITQLRTPPTEVERKDQEHPEIILYEFDKDTVLEDDMLSSIIFQFKFQAPEVICTGGHGTASGLSKQGVRPSALQMKKTRTDPLSSELSSPSESESDLPLRVVSARKHTQVVAAMTGSLNKKKKKRKLAAEVPLEKDVDVLLKKRKIIMRRQEEIEEAKETKLAKRGKLIKALQDDTKARAAKLAKEKTESEQIEIEIQKLEAALEME
ncbi:hypothetical protein C8R44DRAFT_185810 [Mycena epipterygia]|nr:hypothetical protein C8R44DRAFT_185810 [Mycena epipterygia]